MVIATEVVMRCVHFVHVTHRTCAPHVRVFFSPEGADHRFMIEIDVVLARDCSPVVDDIQRLSVTSGFQFCIVRPTTCYHFAHFLCGASVVEGFIQVDLAEPHIIG